MGGKGTPMNSKVSNRRTQMLLDHVTYTETNQNVNKELLKKDFEHQHW